MVSSIHKIHLVQIQHLQATLCGFCRRGSQDPTLLQIDWDPALPSAGSAALCGRVTAVSSTA